MQNGLLSTSLNADEHFQAVKRMNKHIENECTIYFKKRLQMLNRKLLAKIMDPEKCSYDHLYSILLKHFFKNQDKMILFFRQMKTDQDKSIVKQIND